MNLKEFSEKLGLSQTTVSRAMNGHPEVKETTRRRILEAARLHNYAPNARAKGLATGRAMAIGHVIPLTARHEIVNPIFGDFIAGASENYSRNGFEMVLAFAERGEEERVYRNLKAKGAVDGLMVHGPLVRDPRIEVLLDIGLPFVVHGRSSNIDAPYSWLDVNNQRAFQRATDFLLDLGHRRIALINGLEQMDFAHRRRSGFEIALAARGLAADSDLMRSGEMTEALGYHSTRKMLAIKSPPTAFLVSSIICALGVRRAIEEAGSRLGRNVSVITYDDELSYIKNGDDMPIFTATRSSVREAGRHSSEMLLRLIADPSAGPLAEMMEVDLVVGASTGPAPHPSRAP